MDTDIPLQLIKEERKLRAEITKLRKRLTEPAQTQLDGDVDEPQIKQDEVAQTRPEMLQRPVKPRTADISHTPSDRIALIIANSRFDDPKLTQLATPSQDAEALAEVLRDPAIGGFDVALLVDQTLREVRAQIGRLYRRRKKNDLILLYYSGHGIKDDYGDLYLAVKDTEAEVASATAIDATFVCDQIDKSGSQRKVVVLDCCHSGAFARGAKALGSSVGTREAFAGSGYGRVILTASNAIEYAWQGNQQLGKATQSVFTRFLVESLRTGAADLDGDGYISIDELYDYVYEQVVTSGLSKQTPQKWAQKVEGQIVIARTPVLEVSKPSLPAWITEALASGAYSARLAAVGELAQMCQGQDQSLAAIASAELERLGREDENPAVRGAASGALGIAVAGAQVTVEDRVAPVLPKPERIEAPGPDRRIWEKDGKEMVRVPAGKFLYGYPEVKRELPEFWTDRTPVTNAEYARFVAATGHKPPKHWGGKAPPKELADHPVVYVSWRDAAAYAKWAGKRLPTEEEWEKAARGTDGRRYPWGDWEDGRCNTKEAGLNSTTPVGYYSPDGDSPYGCVDMAGNVWEWTSTKVVDRRVARGGAKARVRSALSSQSSKAVDRRVTRGGAWNRDRSRARCAVRVRGVPNSLSSGVGFRCVFSVS
jgi:formylglycine-generating enzyme required for sulfatase activity